jgi:hypothetical protein
VSGWIDGIFVGALGSGLFAFTLFFGGKLLVPWLVGRMHRLPDISGDWESFDEDPNVAAGPVGRATVKQFGTSVRVGLVRSMSRSGKLTQREFHYRGRFLDGQLTLLFEDRRLRGYITGAIVLRLSSNAMLLQGKTTYFDHEGNGVVSHDLWWRRPSA